MGFEKLMEYDEFSFPNICDSPSDGPTKSCAFTTSPVSASGISSWRASICRGTTLGYVRQSPQYSLHQVCTDELQIAGAIDSALYTTAELFGRPIQDDMDMVKKESYDISEKPLPALGRKFASRDEERRARKTDINSRRFKACNIPSHMDVQYVEVSKGGRRFRWSVQAIYIYT